MDTNQRIRLIRKAQTGELTEEEYQQYQELLQNDPTFFEELRWDEFLSLQTKIAKEEEFYEAASQFSMPQSKNYAQQIGSYFQQYPYYRALAATLLLLIVVGGIFWLNQTQNPTYALMSSQQMEVFSVEQTTSRGLGYAEGLPIGELPLQWWQAPNQDAQMAYIFCNDTLKLYIKEKHIQDSLSAKIQLEYDAASQRYAISLPTSKQLLIDTCRTNPETLLP